MAFTSGRQLKSIHHYSEESPRRPKRLVAKDLPNISLFEFDNADKIGHLEAHGFQNQTAQLTTEAGPAGPVFDQPSTDPVAAIDNLSMQGLGGKFLITTRTGGKTGIKHVQVDNTSTANINLKKTGSGIPRLVLGNGVSAQPP